MSYQDPEEPGSLLVVVAIMIMIVIMVMVVMMAIRMGSISAPVIVCVGMHTECHNDRNNAK